MQFKPMRTTQEMLDLIVGVAEADSRIRAVILSGSRTNPDVPADRYQDFDVCYFAHEVESFFAGGMEWVRAQFGNPVIYQLPGSGILDEKEDGFCCLMILDDGNRIDLSIEFEAYIDDGEPVQVLLDKDKDGTFIPPITPNPAYFHVKKPTEPMYQACCNNFWWCLNNVGKGIIRDELPYIMDMLNVHVREMLNYMIEWHIGCSTGFSVTAGKQGKFYKNHLPPHLYDLYRKTYSDSNYDHIWNAVYIMCDLFREVARSVGEILGYVYNDAEDKAMLAYLQWVKISGLNSDS